jgi:hypothetical protein
MSIENGVVLGAVLRVTLFSMEMATISRAGKKLGLRNTLTHKIWGGDQKTLLRIHQMIVLSILRYGESIYGKTSTENIRTDTQQGRETNFRSFCDL